MGHTRIEVVDDQDRLLGEVAASPRESVYEALARSAFPPNSTCRGSTICGLCRVTVRESSAPLPEIFPDERALLGDTPPQVRLACRLELPRGAVLRLRLGE